MSLNKKISFILSFIITPFLCAQTPGFNYQALILNSSEIQIPGTDVPKNQVPLGLEEVTFRFSIANETIIEYSEEQTVITDENGMISLIVGEGTPIINVFDDILWDGNLKYLNVEINILSNDDGFVFLDAQKILYIPHPSSGVLSKIKIINTIDDLEPPYEVGELIWAQEYGQNKKPTLIIWDGVNWLPVNDDFDPTNELKLVVVNDAADRDAQFTNPKVGDQVWNRACGCIEIFDGMDWISMNPENVEAINGLHKDGNTIKLGGALGEPTTIDTDVTNTLSIKGLKESTLTQDSLVVVEQNTGILRKKAFTSLIRQEQTVITAVDGQLRFSTPLLITSAKKIDVYRNGVKIGFTVVNSTTIELEAEAICFKNDQIRIVQLY